MKADETLDCVGLYCPMPIANTANKLKKLEVGQVLEVLADDEDEADRDDCDCWYAAHRHAPATFLLLASAPTDWSVRLLATCAPSLLHAYVLAAFRGPSRLWRPAAGARPAAPRAPRGPARSTTSIRGRRLM